MDLKKLLYRIKVAFLLGVIGFSLFCVVFSINDLMENKADEASIQQGILIFFGLTGCAAIFALVKSSRKHRHAIYELQEREVLKMIAEKSGEVTAFDVASETDMTVEESTQVLDTLCKNGRGQALVTRDGSVLYRFATASSLEERKSAASPLDF